MLLRILRPKGPIAWVAAVICCIPLPLWAGSGLPEAVAQSIAAQRLPLAAVSFAIMDPDSGRVMAAHNPDTPRSPASTLKTVTTFAALDLLGPAYTWHTHALTHGTLANGILDGELILQGGGDPYMTLERWWSFVHALRAKGLQSIHGDVLVDNTAFALAKEDAGAFDGRPNRSYNVLPDALMVNFQSIEFRLVPNPVDRRVDVVFDPAPVNLTVNNHIRLAEGRCSGARARVDFQVASAAWDQVTFSGALSPHCEQRSITRVLLRPETYAFGTFVALWRELGGQFSGKLRVEAAPADALPYVNFDSLSLGEIVRLTNKYSSNLMARHLLLTIGGERRGAPATLEKGGDVLIEWAQHRGIDLKSVDIDNGSGLSRSTHISVMQMARILSAAHHSPYAPEFEASLPLAGVDGTMRSRMKGSPAGAVRLKTGHIDGVSGVAGFVTTAAGKTYVLVCLVNHARADSGAAEPVHAALVDWVLDTL